MSETVATKVTIVNNLGLHARPAMLFVETANKYNADVTVSRADQDETIDGKSIMQMMMLAATKGSELEISATGEQAQECIDALVSLIESGFNE